MKTIYKYPLDMVGEQTLMLPEGAEILAVQVQNNQPCLWARLDLLAKPVERKIITHGTAAKVPSTTGEYIGTYQMEGGNLVFHVFDSDDMRPNDQIQRAP